MSWRAAAIAMGLLALSRGYDAREPMPVHVQDTVLPVMKAIATIEGWDHPDTLVRRLNNPGALMFAGQAGAHADERGYAVFATEKQGWDALRKDSVAKLRRSGGEIRLLARFRCGADLECDAERYADLLCYKLRC